MASKLDKYKDEIIRFYKEGETVASLKRKYDCDSTTITALLEKHGVEKHKLKLQDEYENICRRYDEGESIGELAKAYKEKDGLITAILKKHKVKMRTSNEGRKLKIFHVYKGTRKYKLNEDFFEKIDTPEAAYLLGLFYSDGCNHEKNGSIDIGLKALDRELLEKVKIILGYDGPLYEVAKGYAVRLSIGCRKMSQDLAKLGCVARKSLILKFPTKEQVPKNLIKSFLLGYYDGDGGLSISSGKTLMWSMVGTKDFCKEAKRFIEKETGIILGIRLTNPGRNQITSSLTLGGNIKVPALMDWLYEDAPLWMERKRQKLEEGRKNVYVHVHKLEHLKSHILERFRCGERASKLARDYRVAENTIRSLLTKETGITDFSYANVPHVSPLMDKRDEILEKFNSGFGNAKTLSAFFNTSEYIMGKFLQDELGVKRIPRLNKLLQYKDDILKSFNEGETITQLAKRFDCTEDPVRSLLKENGIKFGIPKPAFRECPRCNSDKWKKNSRNSRCKECNKNYFLLCD